MNKLKHSGLFWLWLSLLIIGADRVTKTWASSTLTYGEPQAVMPFFNFTLLHNTGAAFSLLAGAGGWQRWFFTGLALFVGAVLVLWLSRLPRQSWAVGTALACILGGALGNAWDRLQHGYVVDFIDLYYKQMHWPAFNIADSAITVGAVLLVLDALLHQGPDEKSGAG